MYDCIANTSRTHERAHARTRVRTHPRERTRPPAYTPPSLYRYSMPANRDGTGGQVSRGFGGFSHKKMLGRTDTRTRERMYSQTIQTVREILRDDRARIATCSLRTPTDRQTYENSVCSFRSVGSRVLDRGF